MKTVVQYYRVSWGIYEVTRYYILGVPVWSKRKFIKP